MSANPKSKSPDTIKIASFLARAGVASRRAAEKIVLEGRVEVNGAMMQNVAERVNPTKDKIRVDGATISLPTEHIYLMLNKPKGYITSANDERGRPTVFDLLPKLKRRIFPVGRLDYDTEGLLLLTSDGDWANRIAHPSRETVKTYLVHIRGNLDEAEKRLLRSGIALDDIVTAPATVEFLGESPGGTVWELRIHEGRQRQIRRMFARLRHTVRELKRTAIGTLELGDVKPGKTRKLSHAEMEMLWEK
jgi:23S rRNA pseudouridine2605 synthase